MKTSTDMMTAPSAAVLAATAALLASGPAFSQSYPYKPIRLIVPGPAASVSDLRARWIAGKLAPALGQTIVVDNRPGAGGNIATEAAARSPADGYTLLVAHQGTLALNPHLYPRLGYDPLVDLAPITRFFAGPMLLAVHPAVPATSVSELIELAKERPGQLNYGSPGSGTPPHVSAELFKRMANVAVVHVPYKGGTPALTDLMAGRLTYTFDSLLIQLPYVRSGRIRALAVTSANRVDGLAQVPTVAESGLPGYAFLGWMGIAAPAGTPPHIVNRLNGEIQAIIKQPGARAWFSEQGGEAVTDTPGQFRAYIRSEHARWGPLIRDAGIKAD